MERNVRQRQQSLDEPTSTTQIVTALFDSRPPWDKKREELLWQRHLMDIHYGNFFTTFELDIHGWYPTTVKRVQQLQPYIIAIDDTKSPDIHELYYDLPGNPVHIRTDKEELLILHGDVTKNQVLLWSKDDSGQRELWWNTYGIDLQNALLATKMRDMQAALNPDYVKGPAVALLDETREGEVDVWGDEQEREQMLIFGLEETILMNKKAAPLLTVREIIDIDAANLARINLEKINPEWKGKKHTTLEEAPFIEIYRVHPQLFDYRPIRYGGIMSPTIIEKVRMIGQDIYPREEWDKSELLVNTPIDGAQRIQ